MYKIVKIKRGGRVCYELAFPENILRQHVENLEQTQLRSLLVRLILGEHKSRRLGGNRELQRFHSRLKKKRIAVAKQYREIGGIISDLVLEFSLPSSLNWPGIIGLVKTKGYEDWLLK